MLCDVMMWSGGPACGHCGGAGWRLGGGQISGAWSSVVAGLGMPVHQSRRVWVQPCMGRRWMRGSSPTRLYAWNSRRVSLPYHTHGPSVHSSSTSATRRHSSCCRRSQAGQCQLEGCAPSAPKTGISFRHSGFSSRRCGKAESLQGYHRGAVASVDPGGERSDLATRPADGDKNGATPAFGSD